jgi:hypothetical protein
MAKWIEKDLARLVAVHISIGNTDNKLTQAEWSEFVGKVRHVVHNAKASFDGQIHGEWFSMPDAPWQNACWLVHLPNRSLDQVKPVLASLAATYRQDSIAWTAGDTEFISRSGNGTKRRVDQHSGHSA